MCVSVTRTVGQQWKKKALQDDRKDGGKDRTGGCFIEMTKAAGGSSDNIEERGETVICLCAGHKKFWRMRLDVNTCSCSFFLPEGDWIKLWIVWGKICSCPLADKAVNWKRPFFFFFGPVKSFFLLEAEIHKHLWQACVQLTAPLLLEHHLGALICISLGTFSNTTDRRQAPDETGVTISTLNQEKNRLIDQTATRGALWFVFLFILVWQ